MHDLPITVYTSESPVRNPGKLLRDWMRDVGAGRELAWRLFVRDLSAQYRQTFLGYVWAILPPLAASLTFIFLQSQGIVRVTGTVIPYAAFAMMGTLLWQSFVEAIQSPLSAVQTARPMLAKINFPREALLMAGLYMVGFNFLIRMALLTCVMAAWKIVPGAGLLLFPVAMAGLLALGFAIGLACLPIGSLYGDIRRGIPIVAQFGMLLTPVVYPARRSGMIGWLSTWNPAAPLVVTAREALTAQPFTLLGPAMLIGALAVLAVFVGLLVFRLVMPLLIERMGG